MPSFTGTVRGRVVGTNRAVKTKGGLELPGWTYMVIVHVRNSKRFQKDFRWRCEKLGLDFKPIESGFRVAFEVWGSGESLKTLLGCQCVLEWHYALDVRLPPGSMHRAGGTGPEKHVPYSGPAYTPASGDGLGY